MTAIKIHCGRLEKRKKSFYGLKAFLLGLLVATVIYVPFMIYDNGLFLYYGDFNVQQIPFYQLVHDTIQSGNIGWSHNTDLGANLIGSYSFYLIGSPFFWLTMLFPSQAVPYLMGPLLILKTACMSFTAYVYLRRYTYDKNFAVLGGLLYAFSGFTCFNIFFNHFHEAMIIFPLLLAAVDELFENNRRGVVALAVFGSCIMNYYFFVGQVVFVIIYWFVKIFSGSYELKIKNFLYLIFEAVLGLVATAVILLPSIFCVTENSRVSDTLGGWDALVYNNAQRYINILTAFLFPSELPAYPTFTPDSNTKWGSLSGWLPLFSITGVVAFMTRKNKHWLKKLISLLVFIAFIPILNSMFQIFNVQYYARWMYMLVLMLCLATIISLEDTTVNWPSAIGITTALTAFLVMVIGFMPTKTEELNGEKNCTYGLMDNEIIFWVHTGIAILSLVLLAVIVALTLKKKKLMAIVSIVLVCVISAGYTIYIVAVGKSYGYDSKNYMNALVINHKDDIDLPNSENVRTDFYEMMDNSAMFWQLPTIQTFHSVVPGSVMEFYNNIGVSRDVASRPETSEYAVRSLTSTRWLVDYVGDSDDFCTENGVTAIPGWKYYDKQSEFEIWENEYYIPMGFCYDSYISEIDYEVCPTSDRAKLMLKAMVLSEDQIKKYSFTQDKLENSHSFTYTKNEYFKDCQERKSESCSEFEYTKTGFRASIDRTDKDENTLVFFSVPYENGWSAKVNGKDVDIEKVNVGFMAVEVPANQVSEITFTYKTPGLSTGIVITGVSIVIFIAYVVILKLYERKTGEKSLKKGRKFRIVRNELSLREKAIIKENLRKNNSLSNFTKCNVTDSICESENNIQK